MTLTSFLCLTRNRVHGQISIKQTNRSFLNFNTRFSNSLVNGHRCRMDRGNPRQQQIRIDAAASLASTGNPNQEP
jgi:hypothetical protein